jgi:putative ABC transport system permease protein
MAIGATQGDVQRMVLRQAAWLGVAGVTTGLALAVAVPVLVARMVPATVLNARDEAWIDPAVAGASAAVLIAVVLMAAWLPARRAARIDPTLALRSQ